MSAAVHDPTWDLTLADRPLVEAKRLANRLRFAIMLLFFRAQGRFPRCIAHVLLLGLNRPNGASSQGDRFWVPNSTKPCELHFKVYKTGC